MTRHGGRPAQISAETIAQAGREIGLDKLTMNAVAAKLGVSSTALYRHVNNRWDLERLVGESILSDLTLHNDPTHTATQHLISFGLQLRAFVLDHPGLGNYIRTLFPRGDSGRALLLREVDVMTARGYLPDTAIMIHSAVASITVGLVAMEEEQLKRGDELAAAQTAATQGIEADEHLKDLHRDIPEVGPDRFFRAVLAAAVRGLINVGTPGRPGKDVLEELDRESEGL